MNNQNNDKPVKYLENIEHALNSDGKTTELTEDTKKQLTETHKKQLTQQEYGRIGGLTNLIWTQDKALTLGNQLIDFIETNEQVLYVSQFCEFVKLSKQKISELAKLYSPFQELLQKAKTILENRLLLVGHNGKNFPFTIFTLKNHYNYTDRTDVNVSGTLNLSHSIDVAWKNRQELEGMNSNNNNNDSNES